MGFTSLQVCMDSPDWLQGTINEDYGMDSSSSPSGGDMLNACSRPLIERRLRPPNDQLALKCPRCDSTHTKFCYYNNYSLTQPRYFCKTCRRYWTKGGTLRNIPVGGGCRKNKKASKRTSNEPVTPSSSASQNGVTTSRAQTDLQLSSFPDQFQFSQNMFGNNAGLYNMAAMINENSSTRPIDFMESKLEAIVGSSRNNYDFMGEFGGSGTHHHHNGFATNFCSPFGMASSNHHANNNFMDLTTNYHQQRLTLLPNYDHEDQNGINEIDVKPNTKHLSLEWHQAEHQGNKDQSFGYLGSSWSNGMINGYGSSTTNPLV